MDEEFIDIGNMESESDIVEDVSGEITPIIEDGIDLVSLYEKLFTSYSFKNLTYAKLTFHSILGTLFKNIKISIGGREIDLRTQLFITQSSGSGKTTAYFFLNYFLEELNGRLIRDNPSNPPILQFDVIRGEISEASLVGKKERVVEPQETEHGIINRVVEREITGKMQRLGSGGIMAIDEASILLGGAEKEYTKNVTTYLQMAMDDYPYNKITRQTLGGEIIYTPFISFILTTYPAPLKTLGVLKGGMLQRMLVYFKILNDEEWLKIKDEFVRKSALMEENVGISTDLTELLNGLTVVYNRWKNGGKVKLSENARNMLGETYDELVSRYISKYDGEKKEVLDGYRIRSLVYLIKLSAHRALLHGRNVIVAEDMAYAKQLYFECFESLLSLIDWSMESGGQKLEAWQEYWGRIKKEWFFVEKKLNIIGKRVGEQKLVEFLAGFLGLSESSAYRVLKTWEKKGLIRKELREVIFEA